MCVGESSPGCNWRSYFSVCVLICRLDSTSAHFPALPGASPADFLQSPTPEHNSCMTWHDFILPLSPHYSTSVSPIFSSQADYFSCVATLLYTRKDNCLYQACPSSDCNKKVIDQHNGWFRCEKCNRDFPNFRYRLLLFVSPQHLMLGFHACIAVSNAFTCVDVIHVHSWLIPCLLPFIVFVCLSQANLADAGDNQWVTCFQETAEVLLGHSAETLGQLRGMVRQNA